MSFSQGLKTVDTITRIARKCQLLVKDAPKVKAVLNEFQIQKLNTERELGPIKPRRNRYKKLDI